MPESPTWSAALRSREGRIALLALGTILAHLALRWAPGMDAPLGPIARHELPLLACLAIGGTLVVIDLLRSALRREFGADLLAGISIVTSVVLGEYLAGALVVLMISGGQALEQYAVRSASRVLDALARRSPSVAHRRTAQGDTDVPLDAITPGDLLVVHPHEICPVDGVVHEGRGTMDESYLTGEPYLLSKVPGADVFAGAINGEALLTVRAMRRAVDSRYAKIMAVMRESEQRRPRLRRLGDQLGAWYTPFAVAIALGAWAVSGDPVRFLAVLVVATPCPLLIAIPVAIIGAISLAARRSIVIKDPAVLERVDSVRTAIFDKTGTLSYGRPSLTEIITAPGVDDREVLALVASLERYSRHPLAESILELANTRGLVLPDALEIHERPGQGLTGRVQGHDITVTSRAKLQASAPALAAALPPAVGGMECVVLRDDAYAATFRFRDAVREEGRAFIGHLSPRHAFTRVLLVSGDRESEVRYLADQVGITEVHHSQSPEQKLALVRAETARAPTLFMGDGINDAPALTAATVGIAFGRNSDITAEAAGAVIMDSTLLRVDEFLHIARRLRRIALQSAVGGMALSLAAMVIAAMGLLPPVLGALTQEAIDVVAVLNALRAASPGGALRDFDAGGGAG
ncbi:MAG: heavy metal translocating P-type ATPase [Gemmatimonadaceae bacterium]|nr:heavy metal translocating P-type ATPase [Gemmatimonadaceae bacterium]